MAELVMQAHGCQDRVLQHMVKHREEALLRKYVQHCQRKFAKHVQQRHGGMAGLGFAPTRGAGIPTQYQRVEAAPAWGGKLPEQFLAEGYRYAFPSTESAFLDRSMTIRGGQGGAFTGQIRRGTPSPAYQAMPAYRGPGPVVQQNVWTNPWTAQQWFTGAQGIPIWGGGYTQPQQPLRRAGAQPAVGNAAGQFPAVGSSFERF